jgi:hypothetical protein
MSGAGPYVSANEIRARINRDGVAHENFKRLMSLGADEGVLLGMLVNLGNAPVRNAFEVHTGELSRRQVRAAAKKIRKAADLMRKTRWLLFTKVLSLEDEAAIEGSWPPPSIENIDEFRGLPKSVLDFGRRLERALHRPEFSPDALTAHDDALVMLIFYLKKVTGQYLSAAICELLRAGLNEEVDVTALNEWRYRHKEQIEARLKFVPHNF